MMTKEAKAKWMRGYYQRNKAKITAYKNNYRKRMSEKVNEIKLSKGCCICGYNKCAQALVFHHPDDNKEFHIGKSMHNKSFKNLKKEIDKCDVMCANCHAEYHAVKTRKGEINKEKHTWAK